MTPPAIAPDTTAPRLRVAVARPMDPERRAVIAALLGVALALCADPEPAPDPEPQPSPRPLPGPRGQT